jgi:predicted CoA-binding protein
MAVVMPTLAEAARAFLAHRRIAVVGVSRDPTQPANFNFRKLRRAGFEVFAVNPRAREVEGTPCHPDLRSIPGGVEAVLVFTPAAGAEAVVRECADLGIRHVWLHRSLGPGSTSEAAVRLGRERGLTVIPGGCPAMFAPPVDLGHRCLRWILGLTGSLPKTVEPGTTG